ncbi:MAG: Panacea domain-containing protein [Methylovulum sp.]
MVLNERKVTQMAAYFLQKRGGRMAHLKLMKLLYLADRESLRLYGLSISGDCLVSMPHGPVLSMTLNLMDGDVESRPDGWESLISSKENHELALKTELQPGALDELSKADTDVLETIWKQFGKLSRWQIRDYTHQHCPEWEDQHGSSKPIRFEKLFQALGRPADEAQRLAEQIAEQQHIDGLFAAL